MRNSTSISKVLTGLVLIAALALAVGAADLADAGEPLAPPVENKPQVHTVELKESVTIRMGDSVMLKGTDFSAKLVGFTDPTCANPGPGCSIDNASDLRPEFQYTQGDVTCDSNPKQKSHGARKRLARDCAAKIQYVIANEPVEQRTAVKVRIENRKNKK